jgi:hypothetical protein
MTSETDRQQIDDLDVFVGVWSLTTSLVPPGVDPPEAETTFEWLDGRRFLVQRWHVDHPSAPDGIAVVGVDNDSGRCRHHYFDSRGEARTYEMSFVDGAWKLWRDHPGFFQRFSGTFDETGNTISGSWESSKDGSAWDHDFDMTYARVRR